MEEVHETAEEKKDNEATPDQKLEATLAWGHINFESDKGLVHSSCKAVEFNNAEEVNKWFEENPGMFSNQMIALGDGRFVAIINRVSDPEEQQLLEDRADAIRQIVEEKRKAREEAKAQQKEAEDKRLAELDALIELGKKCKSNHGAVIADNAKLKKENAELRKKVKRG